MKRVFGLMASLLLLATSLGSIGQSAAVYAGSSNSSTTYSSDVLGISFAQPTAWRPVADEVSLPTYGVNFMEELSWGPKRWDGDSNIRLAMRVGMILDASASQLETYVNRDLTEYAALNPGRFSVKVGPYDGVALWPMPGTETVTHVYVAANDHLYQIIYRGELDTAGSQILGALKFSTPTRSILSLNLVDSAAQNSKAPLNLPTASEAQARAATASPVSSNSDGGVSIQAVAGCVDYPSTKGMQTQWSSTANGNGWSWAGPSFFGQGLHTGCNNTGSSNDYYALDHSLRTGDVVYAAYSGTVAFAGWTCGGWASYGKVVIVNLGGGYYNLMAHLNSINVSVGQSVTISTVIGGAGGSGNGSLTYWSPHLHQVTYLNPTIGSCGPYGGQSAMPTKVQYFGNGGGYYTSFTSGMAMSW